MESHLLDHSDEPRRGVLKERGMEHPLLVELRSAEPDVDRLKVGAPFVTCDTKCFARFARQRV